MSTLRLSGWHNAVSVMMVLHIMMTFGGFLAVCATFTPLGKCFPTTGECLHLASIQANWQTAVSTCEGNGYNLLALETEEKHKWFEKIINDGDIMLNADVWLSLHESSGSGLEWEGLGAASYTADCSDKNRQKTCCKFQTDKSVKFKQCNMQNGVICQEASTATPTNTTSTAAATTTTTTPAPTTITSAAATTTTTTPAATTTTSTAATTTTTTPAATTTTSTAATITTTTPAATTTTSTAATITTSTPAATTTTTTAVPAITTSTAVPVPISIPAITATYITTATTETPVITDTNTEAFTTDSETNSPAATLMIADTKTTTSMITSRLGTFASTAQITKTTTNSISNNSITANTITSTTVLGTQITSHSSDGSIAHTTTVYAAFDPEKAALVQCPPIPRLQHATVHGFSRRINSVITAVCRIGYVFIESGTSRTIVCMATGHWHVKISDCIRQ